MPDSTEEDKSKYNYGNALAATFFPCLGFFAYGCDFGATAWSLVELEETGAAEPYSWAALIADNSFLKGFFCASSTLGAVIGVIMGITQLKHLSYKASIQLGGVMIILGSTLQAASGYLFKYSSVALSILFGGRLIYGLAIGLIVLTVPKYIGEVAPPSIRGTLSSGMEFAVVCGMTFSYTVGYFSNKMGRGWELVFQVESIPAVMMLIGLNFIPESPRLLLRFGHSTEEALAAAKMITPNIDRISIETLRDHAEYTKDTSYLKQVYELFSGKLAGLVWVALLLVLMQQTTGAPAVSYYIVTILDNTYETWSSSNLMYHLMGIGAAKILGDVLAVSFIDHVGRKSLLLVGFGMAGATNFIISCQYKFGYDADSIFSPFLLLTILMLACEFTGTVAWVFLGELFPMEIKDTAMSVCVITNFFANFVLNEAFGFFEYRLQYPFLFFAACALLSVGYVFYQVPRVNSNMPMEAMQTEFIIFCCGREIPSVLSNGNIKHLGKKNNDLCREDDSLLSPLKLCSDDADE